MLPSRHRAHKFLAALALASLAPILAGCHSETAPTPENFIPALNAYFLAHPDCLYPTPLQLPYETSDPVETTQLNALATSQLLTVERERSLHVSRYTATYFGARYAPNFCYGHRVVTAIENFTPPAQANGFPETHVTYTYTLQNVPVWARSQSVLSAFPAMAQAIGATSTGNAILAVTMAGWQVPD